MRSPIGGSLPVALKSCVPSPCVKFDFSFTSHTDLFCRLLVATNGLLISSELSSTRLVGSLVRDTLKLSASFKTLPNTSAAVLATLLTPLNACDRCLSTFFLRLVRTLLPLTAIKCSLELMVSFFLTSVFHNCVTNSMLNLNLCKDC